MKDLHHNSYLTSKKNTLFIILTGFFLTNAILAEIIGVKIFSLEKTLSLPAAQIPLFADLVLDFNLTAGVVIWPVVFITTDLINEYFGKSAVKKISYLACFLIGYGFLAIWLARVLSPADFWIDINKGHSADNEFNIDHSFNVVFKQGLNIIVGSLVAFLIGQILDAYIFARLKSMTKSKMLWLRATGSTLVSQLIDSFVVLFIAFYFMAGDLKWPLYQIFSVGIINYIYKFTIAILLTPLLYIVHSMIDRFLGQHKAETMVEEAILD